MTTIEKPRIRVFTKEELEAIVGATENDQEQAMVAFMLDCGPRTGETAAMRLEDVGDDCVLLHGKTGPRTVPVSPEVINMLCAQARGNIIWADSQGRAMSTSPLQYRIRRIMKRAGITGQGCSPQALRRTFASHYLRAGGSFITLSRILGHCPASISFAGSAPQATQLGMISPAGDLIFCRHCSEQTPGPLCRFPRPVVAGAGARNRMHCYATHSMHWLPIHSVSVHSNGYI